MREQRLPAFDAMRMQAWSLLQRIEHSRAYADLLLDHTFSSHPQWRPLDRSFIQELVLGTLRWQARLDSAIHRTAKSPEKKIDPRLLHLLRTGAYQILFMDRVPHSAAVNESVRLAKALFKNDKISGFTNAVLRSIARNKNQEAFPPFESQPIEYITEALSHPRWMVERWVREFGPEIARKICAANNLRPPFTVRVNTLKTSREILQGRFAAAGIESLPTPFSPEGLVLRQSPSLPADPLFREGFYFVQDEASQIISHLVNPQPGERVLDACAAPGGKSTHMAQLMEDRGEILSLDLYDPKLDRIRENCRRMGISIIQAFRVDASKPLPFPQKITFDRILVDAPCTGLGILHRHPEAKWRQRPQDVQRLQRLQVALLKNVSSRLKPGGVLIYSTCTMTQEENDFVVDAFLSHHKDFHLQDLRLVAAHSFHPLIEEKGLLRTYPRMTIPKDDYRLDGFFAARMIRE
ncbi:MAG: 16S rRNA (cytosine(967)-C(5))-methyltransferase RsmB [Thermodesulfobacteriota bacterium]|jgi:16S rRNA (cytosine967-C5)-methyltransferase